MDKPLNKDEFEALVNGLITEQLIYSIVGEDVSKVNIEKPQTRRDCLDAYYRGRFEADGAKTFDVPYFGQKGVVTYSVRTTKAKEATKTLHYSVEDEADLIRWLTENRAAEELLLADPYGIALWWMDEYGEVPDGIKIETETTKAEPGGEYQTGVLKVVDRERAEEIAGEILGRPLRSMVLGGGSNGVSKQLQ